MVVSRVCGGSLLAAHAHLHLLVSLHLPSLAVTSPSSPSCLAWPRLLLTCRVLWARLGSCRSVELVLLGWTRVTCWSLAAYLGSIGRVVHSFALVEAFLWLVPVVSWPALVRALSRSLVLVSVVTRLSSCRVARSRSCGLV